MAKRTRNIDKEDIKKLMSHLGKLSHKKKPRSKEFYSKIAKIRHNKKTCPQA